MVLLRIILLHPKAASGIAALLSAFCFLLLSGITVASPAVHPNHPGASLDSYSPSAPLDTLVKYGVTIEHVLATNNFDGSFGWDRADFFARVRIDDQVFESSIISNDDDISPDWEFSELVNVADFENDTISVSIEVWDSDEWGNWQQADLTSDADRGLTLTIDANECTVPGTDGSVTGTIHGSCGQTLTSEGTASENTADINFRIEAERPPSATDMQIRCLHDPVWPQAGETVTVQAEALNDGLNAKIVDVLEVWFGSVELPAQTCNATNSCSASQVAPSSGNSMFYGCLARDGSEEVWTGWRRVQVGSPTETREVPILFTGPRASRIDIVFVPDEDSYSAATDPDFHAAVRSVILNAYYGRMPMATGTDAQYGERLFLSNQDKLNFWIAQDLADTDGTSDECLHLEPPDNWADYSFADTGVILHDDPFRDCADRSNRIFGSEPTSERTILHETGHSPFGLADEYCCDSYYWQPDPFPNIYSSLDECQADAINLQAYDLLIGDSFGRTSSACELLSDPITPGNTNGWYTSEPVTDGDIMFDRGEFNGADIRKIEDGFEQCARADCDELTAVRTALLDSPSDPVPEFDFDDSDKIVLVTLDFNGREQVTFDSSTVVYGKFPAHFSNAPLLRVDLFDPRDQLIDQFYEWHPLLLAGTVEVLGEFSVDHNPVEWLDEGNGRFLLPFSPDLAKMEITDIELEQSLIAIDLVPTIQEFCEAHSSDPDCDAMMDIREQKIFLPLLNR